MTHVPDFVYTPIEERTKEELLETLKMNKEAIKKHTILAKWGNVDSRVRLREIRAVKKRVEAALAKFD